MSDDNLLNKNRINLSFSLKDQYIMFSGGYFDNLTHLLSRMNQWVMGQGVKLSK